MRRLSLVILGLAVACRYDTPYRDEPDPSVIACTYGLVACVDGRVTRCDFGSLALVDDCIGQGMVCIPDPPRCTPCTPYATSCEGNAVLLCDAEGRERTIAEVCDLGKGSACRRGACVDLCGESRAHPSNVGCELWPVDLDNAVLLEGDAAG